MVDSDGTIILMADDDWEDRLLAEDALEEAQLENPLHFVSDGEQLMDYLRRCGEFTHLKNTPLPGLILLDLNMPKKDGREALHEIKQDPKLRHIPTIILTTSRSEADIVRTYDLGVNSFITKPVTFEGLVDVMRSLGNYWFNTVVLPSKDCGDNNDC